MFDPTFLPPADFEFVVIADTHYMIDVGGSPLEFESRRRQTARAEYALRLVAGLQTPLVIHMGDLNQEFPERPHFAQAQREALEQLARCGVQPRFVAGNHDVGDIPDPTMPASWVTPDFLADNHAHFGRSWQSWEEGDLHFVILNSQIMNSALPEAAEQTRWLEQDLAEHAGQPIFLFLHMPPYLHDPQEPDLGHYDNLGQPARGWLLDLLQRYPVQLVCAAHVHFSWLNQIGKAPYYTVLSPAFTRPGFSELFSSPPPPEQGRDDRPKLGFYLMRVQEDGLRVHRIRTEGRTGDPDQEGGQRLLTRTSPDLPHSPLGLVLHHPLTNSAQVPLAWPSTIRQAVRNDYPLLACLELGARHLQIPYTDLLDPLQEWRLAILREQGVSLTATCLWQPGVALAEIEQSILGKADGVLVHHLGSPRPHPDCLAQIARLQLPVTLSCVVPGHQVTGKQHNRSQIGYRPEELADLNQLLVQAGVAVARMLCRLDPAVSPLEQMNRLAVGDLSHIAGIDWVLAPSVQDDQILAQRVAGGLVAVAGRKTDRFFLEPFRDLDRTMDSFFGLLDRLCNPRPAFFVAKNLNTLLFSWGNGWKKHLEASSAGDTTIHLGDASRRFRLVIPQDDGSPVMWYEGAGPGREVGRQMELGVGTWRDVK